MGIRLNLRWEYVDDSLARVMRKVEANPELLGKPLPFSILNEAVRTLWEDDVFCCYSIHAAVPFPTCRDAKKQLLGLNVDTGSFFSYDYKKSNGVYYRSTIWTSGKVFCSDIDKSAVMLTSKMQKRLKWAYQQIDALYSHLEEHDRRNNKYVLRDKRKYYTIAEVFFLLDAIARDTAKGRNFSRIKPMTVRVDALTPDISGLMNATKWIPADRLSDETCDCEMYVLPLYPRCFAPFIMHGQEFEYRKVGCFPGFVLRIRRTGSGSAWAVGFTSGSRVETSVLKYGRSGGYEAKKAALQAVKEIVANYLLGEDCGCNHSLRNYLERNAKCYKLTPVNCTIRERVESLDVVWNALLSGIMRGNQYQEIKDFYANLFDHTPAIYLENCHEKD